MGQLLFAVSPEEIFERGETPAVCSGHEKLRSRDLEQFRQRSAARLCEFAIENAARRRPFTTERTDDGRPTKFFFVILGQTSGESLG